MSDLSRRQFLAGTAGAGAAVALRAPRVHAQKSGGTLRFIPHADLKALDPVWTTAYITRNHCYMVYDTLFGTDEKLQIKPQMVEKFGSSDKGMKWSSRCATA
jgi:peptide/nickel transport system substrate-binding protein